MCKNCKFHKCIYIILLITAKNLRYISHPSFAPMILPYSTTPMAVKTAVKMFLKTFLSYDCTFQRLQKFGQYKYCNNKQTLKVMTNIITLEIQHSEICILISGESFQTEIFHIMFLWPPKGDKILLEIKIKSVLGIKVKVSILQIKIPEKEVKSKSIRCKNASQ